MSPEYFAVHAQGGVPAIGGGPLSARGAAGQPGRLYLVVESADIYLSRDSGADWRDIRSGDDAASTLTKIKTVDGSGSGLDADTLDGLNSTAFAVSAHNHDAAYVNESDHTKAVHDAMLIDAATLDGVDSTGFATLVAGVVPESQIPAVAITDVFEVASQAAMLALTAQRGDVAVRSDINKSFVLRAVPATTLSNWAELRTPTDAVLSVDGRTGAVSLSDLYAAANDARLRVIRDEGTALTNRPAIDFTGEGVIVSDDSVGGRTQVNISGTAAGLASETAQGIVEIATPTELQNATAGVLVPDAAKLAAEITRRLTPEAWITPTLLNGWVNFGAPRESLSFRKTTSGDVVIRGNVKSGASGTVVFTLPTGYRPANERLFPSISGGGGSPSANITVTSAGAVNASLGTGNNTQVTVEVRFDV